MRLLSLLLRGAALLYLLTGAITSKWYGLAASYQWGATTADRIDWVNDPTKVTLHTVTYVPNQDTDDYFNDATNEITGTGYTAGGITLTGKTLTYDGASNTVRQKASDVTWSTATFTARTAVYRKDTGTSSTSRLISYTDFGADQSPAGVNFTIQHDTTDGVVRAVVS